MLYTLVFFFFNDTATTEIYTLSLHDALPISTRPGRKACCPCCRPRPRCTRPRTMPCCSACCSCRRAWRCTERWAGDRKSTRLNSSHLVISYAVFCLKKKITTHHNRTYHSII